MANCDSLGVAIEFKNNKISHFFKSDRGSVFFGQVLHVARSFESVWQSNNGLVAVNLDDCSRVLRSHSKYGFEYFPRVFFELLVAEAHAAIVFVQFENNNINGITNAAEFRRVLDFLRPAQVRNVNKTINAFFELYEQTKVGEVAYGSRLL